MLLTSGCSFVWGDELKGFEDDPPSHWDHTFTHILANRMGMDYVNQGLCGSSNDRIFRDVIDYLHNPENETPTHMVIIWSAWQRNEMVEEMSKKREVAINASRPLEHTQFSPQRLNVMKKGPRRRVLEQYYNGLYDSKTDISHGITKMKAMEVICDSMGIQLIQGVFHGRCWHNILKVLTNSPSQPGADDKNIVEYVPEFANWLKNSISSLRDTSRVGLGKHVDLFSLANQFRDVKPYGHPGERTQKAFAEFLHDQFKRMEADTK